MEIHRRAGAKYMNQTATASSLYECTVLHERFAPKRHRFSYRLFYFAIDLEKQPDLGRLFVESKAFLERLAPKYGL